MRILKPIGLVLVVLISFLGYFSFVGLNPKNSTRALATTGNNKLLGWAWAANIGWISLSCQNDNCNTSNYQVEFEPFLQGKFTGYAFSSNIGWIKLDPAGPYPEAPNLPAQLNSVRAPNGKLRVVGWARACAVMANPNTCSGEPSPLNNNGGWDGWIKMSNGSTNNCPNFHATPPQTGPYETCLTADYSALDGWAWGGNAVGWIEFDPNAGDFNHNNVFVPSSSTKFKEVRPR